MGDRQNRADVILIGAGIMSATLGTMLKELAPDLDIIVLERRSQPGEESSNEWNNAGTGHASLCELNYTTEKADGSIDISKAVKVNEEFQLSRQFWSYLVRRGLIRDPQKFIMPVPHMSFVQGERDVAFLKKRFEAMSANPLFEGMEFSDAPDKLAEWIPLMMENRTLDRPIAATRIESGTDVNFGALTRMLFAHLKNSGAQMLYHRHVQDMQRTTDGKWELKVRNVESGAVERYSAPFVFIGAGGGSLHLLQKSGIAEGRGIGGFPVSGLFMVCRDPEMAKRHYAKVYGKAAIGAPPMSVPHLDTRFIDGKPSLLFGPFAGFTPKFLKFGSNLDLLKSVKPHNLVTMIAAGVKNMSLTTYLIKQLMLTKEQRVEELRQFVPHARSEDWDLIVAGQRVQIIKDTETGGRGTLQFGTEVISAADGSVAALLGASPGASTAVAIMLEVIKRCFPEQLKAWREKIGEMVPSWGIKLSENPDLVRELHEETAKTLGLDRSAHPARQYASTATS
ncbi:Probable malate:quinone oxidoreductase [Thermobacillus xylanilyticus]|jgi:malate dehydrogenase (quinone)|uniref:Probable malate:quinone oxidoreductase n=1 Tax=Thermobacillus xylanilyticus TaxID=76633 RepID=A0ABM8UZ56_THEXY|nr:malate dehydrogenase (quinone) [Thermobacillus xylanilyticus]CAG5076196.1 Probable malate:quinone oxidoreductase [Thermobacillus xylanilyticus]